MSLAKPHCEQCNDAMAFVRYSAVADGREGSSDELERGVRVLWGCEGCRTTTSDLCELGPVVMKAGGCPRCGGLAGEGDGACAGCGRDWPSIFELYGLGGPPGDEVTAQASSLFEEGLIGRAAGQLNTRLSGVSEDPQALRAKCEMLATAGLRNAAHAVLEQGLAAGVGWKIGMSLTQLSLRRKDLDGALKAARASLDSDPGGIPLWHLYVTILLQLEWFETAVDATTEALDHPMSIERRGRFLADRACALIALGRGEEAVLDARAALRQTPRDPRTLYQYGRALALLGQLDRARHQIAAALELNPDMAPARAALEHIGAALSSSPAPGS